MVWLSARPIKLENFKSTLSIETLTRRARSR